MPNNPQTYAYFDDCTIMIYRHVVRIKIHEHISQDLEENDFQIFTKAMSYVNKLSNIGIEGEGMYLEDAHFARVNSIFADVLEKHLKKDGKEIYKVELENGKKFWIDRSPPNRIEDETDDNKLRGRLDEFISDLQNSKSVMSDVDKAIENLDKMRDVVSGLVKIEILRHQSAIPQNQTKLGRPNYFG